MAKQEKHDKGKVDNIKDIHESEKSLDRAANKKVKPKGKTEKILREWVEDIDSE